MPDYRKNILEQFNNDQVLGKGFSGDDKRYPKQISQTASGPYNVTQLSYPSDLSVAADLQHYMVFYINIRSKTRFKNQSIVDVDVSTRGQNRVARQTLTAAGATQAGITAGVASFGVSKNLLERSKVGQKIVSSIAQKLATRGASKASAATVAVAGAATAAAAATGVASAGAAATLTSLSDSLKVDEPARLSDAIMLPIDSIPQVRYQMTYDEYDAGITAGLMGGTSAIDSNAAGRVGEGVARGLLALADLGKIAGLGNAKQNLLTGAAAQTNPFREVFFKSINFRNFSFNYTFLPKSEEEVFNVKRIIDLFKFHMHPELSDDGFFYIYPSEFEIAYYHKGSENPFMNKISTCVLTDMNVSYGGQMFTAFSNGAPSEIKLTLTFKELELMTKERIVKGY
jgi:hypothetical protein